ncbi:MarR family winged helix-turn-helix transcriptional regulator [Leptospira interrogans]
MKPSQFALADSPLHLLHRVSQIADEIFSQHTANLEVTSRQFIVLQAIDAARKTNQQKLVRRTGIDRSTLADIVRRLAKQGMVQRERSEDDAREYVVSLTDKARAILQAVQSAQETIETELLKPLPAGYRRDLLRSLQTIAKAFPEENRTIKKSAKSENPD